MSSPNVDDLVARATDHELLAAADGKSGARLERVRIDGEPHVIKTVSYTNDWLMQAIDDRRGAAVLAWQAGIFDRLPECLDHATVAMDACDTDGGVALTIVMRDVTEWLVPDGDNIVPPEQHARFLDHMAALHATFWGWSDDIGLITLPDRYSLMTRGRISRAGAASPDAVVPPLILQGWEQLPSRAPAMADALFALHDDPSPLCHAIGSTPQTFLHGDWKMANLGSHADGRTVIVDWSFPGAGPPCAEIAHYIGLNRARIPESKDEAIATYRAALESHGVDTTDWWDRQITLSLLGIMCALGWEKALGDEDELRWWEQRVAQGVALL